MRLAERLGMYTQIGALFEIYWPADASVNLRSVPFDFVDEEHRNALDTLWYAMAEEFDRRAIGVRDFEYLAHRYRDHPVQSYIIHLVFDSGDRLLGIVVARKAEHRLVLVDFVGRQRDFRNLVFYAKSLAKKERCSEMFGWMTDIDFDLISGTGGKPNELPLRLPFGIYREGLDPEEIRDRWFFMCGDSDFW